MSHTMYCIFGRMHTVKETADLVTPMLDDTSIPTSELADCIKTVIGKPIQFIDVRDIRIPSIYDALLD